MGASGHIAGVINPPAKNKRSHWIRADGKLPKTHAAWLHGATEHPGSWWTDWAQWLKAQAGKQIAAPKAYGRGKYKEKMPAPGNYVLAKA
jgi:polyhydroxyalkanoate synthase